MLSKADQPFVKSVSWQHHRHLDIFYAVMTCGSLTRAAEVLHISQPAASKAL
ncbi:LysR family transcriptional regulator, partial [Morganella morganii]